MILLVQFTDPHGRDRCITETSSPIPIPENIIVKATVIYLMRVYFCLKCLETVDPDIYHELEAELPNKRNLALSQVQKSLCLGRCCWNVILCVHVVNKGS